MIEKGEFLNFANERTWAGADDGDKVLIIDVVAACDLTLFRFPFYFFIFLCSPLSLPPNFHPLIFPLIMQAAATETSVRVLNFRSPLVHLPQNF